ncbi:MAG TPA: hypothetical protein VHY58_10755 [Streptosporangiaceae bacterium]|jgi:hypothetical protein|nr:hypothetical protein [Streptosporangiaceae bacterium]
MAQQTLVGRTDSDGARPHPAAAPLIAVQVVGALLALTVATVHVADQGGITAVASPAWIGWGYRIIEVGGVLTAITLLLPWARWLGWAAGILLGVGPFAAYILSRSVGVPGDPGDVGNWGYWVGTLSLVLEAALMVLCVAMLLAYRPRSSST